MEGLTFGEVTKAIKTKSVNHAEDAIIKGISIDSRNVQSGTLFFAIKGEHFDGHDFIEQSVKSGAVGAIISCERAKDPVQKGFPLIQVEDTIKALGDLAQYYRLKLKTRVIAITGSNGKTTTKEMTYHLLSRLGKTIRPQKSFNNNIGVPLTIFEMEPQHAYGILEMGTNAPGEIRRLSEIGKPDIAAIINISRSHLEGLGNKEGVARAKAEILENLRSDGVFVYNADDPWCVQIAEEFEGKKVGFGFGPSARIRCSSARKTETGYRFVVNGSFDVSLPILGYHNINNCLASFAICHALGHDMKEIPNDFSCFTLPQMRTERRRVGNITCINDAYNANPESMLAALRYLKELDTPGRKIFICGDMIELGDQSLSLHKEIGEKLPLFNIDVLWTIGQHALQVGEGARDSGMHRENIYSFMSIDDISKNQMHELKEGDTILIKGSRGMHMEKIMKKIENFFAKQVPVHNYV